jgi:serine phosphatase RsbU (regulator of sigma subunit)
MGSMVRRFKFIFFIVLVPVCLFAQQSTVVVLNNDFEGCRSIAKSAWILEDKSHKVTFDELKNHPADFSFSPITLDNTNLQFTTSNYWVKFKIRYEGTEAKEFFIRAARPITNLVQLYVPDTGGVYTIKKSGDGIAFAEKDVAHRSTVFQIKLYPGTESEFYLLLGSDGEVINLPIQISDNSTFRERDYSEQYFLGIYYGMLLFVFLLYFYFFWVLRKHVFFYYVFYVLSIALLQFSLDGLAAQYFFPNNPWMASHMVLFSASMTLFFVTKYAKDFLDTVTHFPKLTTYVYNTIIILAFLFFGMSMFNGFIYELVFPLVNVLSLLATLIILYTVYLRHKKGAPVTPLFTIAFVFLTLGAIVFILNNLSLIPNNFITENGLKLGNGLEVIFLSFSMVKRYRELQEEKEKAQAETLKQLQEMNRMTDQINIQLEIQVKERTAEISAQKEIIEAKNKDITDSILYTRRIQDAVLAAPGSFETHFQNSFIYYQPKDIVSGDFYWFTKRNDKIIVASADCTGHGVPGAFMAMLGNTLLNEIVSEKGITQPSEILNALRNGIINSLKQGNASSDTKDGMDIALISYDKRTSILEYAGAKNPLYIIRNNELIEVKADRFPVGVYSKDELQPFVNHSEKIQKNDCIYIFTDGFADQFGGAVGKKFKYSQLREILIKIHLLEMKDQKTALINTFESWKGSLEQVDDVLIVGIRI